jgi:hypothetical protein
MAVSRSLDRPQRFHSDQINGAVTIADRLIDLGHAKARNSDLRPEFELTR